MLLGWSAMCYTKCEQCEKGGKVYVERFPRSERFFEHLTKRDNMVISQGNLPCFASRCSLVLINLTVDFTGKW